VKALKHIAGVVLASVGVTLLLAAVMAVSEPDPEVSPWIAGAVLLALSLVPLGGASFLLWKEVKAPPKPCPKCGGTEQQPAGVLQKSHSLWLFHLCGWLVSSLWGASRKKRVRCTQCEALYMTDTRGTRVAGIILWVPLLLMVSGVIAEWFKKR